MSRDISNLPSNIIQNIFTYLPQGHLLKIVDIPSIRNRALYALYGGTIRIGRTPVHSLGTSNIDIGIEKVGYEFELQDDELELKVENPEDLLDLVNSGQIGKPREILFSSIQDLLKMVNLDRAIFQNVKVGFDMQYFMNTTRTDNQVSTLQEILAIIPRFNSLENIPEPWLITYLSTVQQLGPYPKLSENEYAVRFLYDTMPYLTALSIDRIFTKEAIGLLPRGLKQFAGSFDCTYVQPQEILPFPEGLEFFALTLPESPATINISHLYRLKNFQVFSANENHHFVLPSNIKIFASTNGFVYIDEIVKQSPNLRVFGYKSFTGSPMKTAGNQYLANSKISVLTLPQHELFATHPRMSLKLPRSLQQLTIESAAQQPGTESSVGMVILDLLTNRLPLLTILNIIDVQNFGLVGSLPPSLTELKFYTQSEFRVEWMQNLPNLRKLYIKNTRALNTRNFQCNPQLELLEISHCSIREARILAPKLKYLNLSNNFLDPISYANLVIPDTVVELDLSYNRIRNIDPNFKFPKRLRKLIFDGNAITPAYGLPLTLKELSICNNVLDLTAMNFWPRNIEKLRLNNTKINDADLEIIDLKSFRRLQRLSLNKNSITTLNVSILPPSLTHLSVQDNRMQTISGSFASLPNLQELDISGNDVGHYFTAEVDIGLKATKLRYLNIPQAPVDQGEHLAALGQFYQSMMLRTFVERTFWLHH
ncbi:hypothetical protein G210_1062 [Candida maltosa Xu316]|uniref:F-box domain-containing protein n=1 Tax=Candida maltosa (strain Xu316) TaxID=1245528 RepID=M3K0X6_CANMX|nr:hypothetical protein G210_1062 [Candida maltosa Xu316]